MMLMNLKHNQLVVKVSVSILLICVGFRLLFSHSSKFQENSETAFIEPIHSVSENGIQVSRNGTQVNGDQMVGGEKISMDSSGESLGNGDEIPKGEKCDIFTGDWVPTSTGPLYTNETCNLIEDHQNCMRNGRPDTAYLYWKWRPRDCELQQFNTKKFLDMMRNKSWALIGDSITRNHIQSLLCMLSKVEQAVQVYHDEEYKSKRWHFPSHNLTISVIWSPFLTKSAIFEDINGVSSADIELHLDKLDPTWLNLYPNLDYIIFSSGKWFVKTAIYHENNTIIGCHGCTKNNLTELGFNFAYRKVIQKVFDFIVSSNHKGTIFYRSSTSDHFENGFWYDGGKCIRTGPVRQGEFEMNDLNKYLREVELEEFEKTKIRAFEKGIKLKFLDVMNMSLMRPDGHPGYFRHFHPFISDVIPTKKGRSRKALKPKNSVGETLLQLEKSIGKENQGVLSGKKKPVRCFEEELREMQEKMEKMRIEKEQTEETLREKEEVLREKETEIVTRGKENEEMKAEIRKLQKMKEFKPTMSLPIVQSLREKDQDKKEKKKGGAAQMKKPSTAYILWCKDQWNEVKKENPSAVFGEITIILGAKWKTATYEEKQPYEEKYQLEKEVYLKIVGTEKRENKAMRLLEEEQKQKTAMELLDQYLQFKQDAEKDNKKTKKEKDPLKPKRPMSAFFEFINERRAELRAENKSVVEVSKITGEEWKIMTEKQKSPYEERAKQNKAKYMEEMDAYKKKKEEEESALKGEEEQLMKIHKQEALQLLKKKERTVNIIKKTKVNWQKKKEAKKDDPNRPKKPASSFLLFSKQARKDLLEKRQGMNNSTITALTSVKWKELSKEEKQVWNEKAAEAMEAYKKDLEDYSKSKEAKETNTQE